MCVISVLYTVEDNVIVTGLLTGTGKPEDLQKSSHLVRRTLTLFDNC